MEPHNFYDIYESLDRIAITVYVTLGDRQIATEVTTWLSLFYLRCPWGHLTVSEPLVLAA